MKDVIYMCCVGGSGIHKIAIELSAALPYQFVTNNNEFFINDKGIELNTALIRTTHPDRFQHNIDTYANGNAKLINLYLTEDDIEYMTIFDRLVELKRSLNYNSKSQLGDISKKFGPLSIPELQQKYKNTNLKNGYDADKFDMHSGKVLFDNPDVLCHMKWSDIMINNDATKIKEICDVIGSEYNDAMPARLKTYWDKNMSMLMQYKLI